ncbi:MAG: hypothetical protein Q7J44_15260 [Pseudotabrizicola sp.]|uniref:hypothetical protein n=1 Tax=Pseudotabrizicola sp. TaxID=2939647 RepID=UPI002723CE4B|nr:hypothetical protein [Pseudotabrizicola sp.]MDO9639895.1 hypothetical protein [Pseudotabrizicola sp.]
MVDKPSRPHPPAGTAAEPSGTAAANGHWVHDDVGPRLYVPPDAGDGPDVATAQAALESLDPALAACVHLTLDTRGDDGHPGAETGIILSGTLPDSAARAKVLRVISAALPGTALVNQLTVDHSKRISRHDTPRE